MTALYEASRNGHDEIVRALLAAKATVNIQRKVGFVVQTYFPQHAVYIVFLLYVQPGQTPLWTASFSGYQKCMELLIDAGANVDIPNEEVSVSSCTHISEATSHRASPCSV